MPFGYAKPGYATGFSVRVVDISKVISLVLLQLCALCMLPVERALFMTGLVSLVQQTFLQEGG